jgi:hypothetical protein
MIKETKGSQRKGVRPMTSGIEGGWRKQELRGQGGGRDGVYIRGSKRWLRPVEILGFHYFFFILFSLISL